jgi:methanogenic corrinoid protein MtbC1
MPDTHGDRRATAEKIATLIRIYRAAVVSGDESLRRATAENLSRYGIRPADLFAPKMKKGGKHE